MKDLVNQGSESEGWESELDNTLSQIGNRQQQQIAIREAERAFAIDLSKTPRGQMKTRVLDYLNGFVGCLNICR